MRLETLYKRTKTSSIQFWEVGVQNQGEAAQITKTAGKLGTAKPTTHTEKVAEGKNIGRANQTTPYDQAVAQATSDWNKKRDEGYKSPIDLGISTLEENGKLAFYCNGTRYTSITEVLENALSQFNTDASGNIKPMKAPTKPWKAGSGISYPQRLEAKLDGVRATLVIPEELSDIKFLSSSGKEYGNLKHLAVIVGNAILEGKWVIDQYPVILDGEIYRHGMTLEEINEAVRKMRSETLTLEYWIFDLPLHAGVQTVRTAAVTAIAEKIDSPMIKIVEGVNVHNDEEVKQHHDIWAQYGYEGAMLKSYEGIYQQGQRSSFWKKVKEFDDTEFEIVDHLLGQRGVEDLMFICNSDGGQFEVKMSGTRESKQKLYDRALTGELKGQSLTVKHFGYTKYNIPYLPTGKSLRHAE